MDNQERIKIHEDYAREYDSQVKEYNAYAHAVLFGMCYEHVNKGETLLDLGTGTGLSSINFARAGLVVDGMDASPGMLEECRKKGFARELKQHSIMKTPLPYDDNSFSHVICCGVFHFFGDLAPYFSEAGRIGQKNGVFGFTVASLKPDDTKPASKEQPGYLEAPSAWGVPMFKHSDNYIYAVAGDNGFSIEKEQKLLAESGEKNGEDILFKAIVAIKN